MNIRRKIILLFVLFVISISCIFAADNEEKPLTYEDAVSGFNFNAGTTVYFTRRFESGSSNRTMTPENLVQLSNGMNISDDSYPAFKLLHMAGINNFNRNSDYDYYKLGSNFMGLYNNWAYKTDELFYLLKAREIELPGFTYKWDNEGECFNDLNELSKFTKASGMTFEEAFAFLVRVPDGHMKNLPNLCSRLYSAGFSEEQLKELIMRIEPSGYDPDVLVNQLRALTDAGIGTELVLEILSEYNRDFYPGSFNFRSGYNPDFSGLLSVLDSEILMKIINKQDNPAAAMYLFNRLLQAEEISVDELAELAENWNSLLDVDSGTKYFLESVDEYLKHRNRMLGVSYLESLPELISGLEKDTDFSAGIWAELMLLSFRIPANQHDIYSLYKDQIAEIITKYDVQTVKMLFSVEYGFFNNYQYRDIANEFIETIPAIKEIGLEPVQVVGSIAARKRDAYKDFFGFLRNNVLPFYSRTEDEKIEQALGCILLTYDRLLYNDRDEYFNSLKKIVSSKVLYTDEKLEILEKCCSYEDFVYSVPDKVIDGYLTVEGMHFLTEYQKNQLIDLATFDHLDPEFLYGVQGIMYATGCDFDFFTRDFLDPEKRLNVNQTAFLGRTGYLLKTITDMSNSEIYAFLKSMRYVKQDLPSFNRDFLSLKLLSRDEIRHRLELYKNLAENNRMTEYNYTFLLDLGEFLNERGMDRKRIEDLQRSISSNRYLYIADKNQISFIDLKNIFNDEGFSADDIIAYFETYWGEGIKCDDIRRIGDFVSYNNPPATASQAVRLTRAAEYTDFDGICNRIYIPASTARDLIKVFGNDMDKISDFIGKALEGFNNEQEYFRYAISNLPRLAEVPDITEADMLDFIRGFATRARNERDSSFRMNDFMKFLEESGLPIRDAAYLYTGYYKDPGLLSEYISSIGGFENLKRLDGLIYQGRVYNLWRIILDLRASGQEISDIIKLLEESGIDNRGELDRITNIVDIYNLIVDNGEQNPAAFKAVLDYYHETANSKPEDGLLFEYKPDSIANFISEAE